MTRLQLILQLITSISRVSPILLENFHGTAVFNYLVPSALLLTVNFNSNLNVLESFILSFGLWIEYCHRFPGILVLL